MYRMRTVQKKSLHLPQGLRGWRPVVVAEPSEGVRVHTRQKGTLAFAETLCLRSRVKVGQERVYPIHSCVKQHLDVLVKGLDVQGRIADATRKAEV